MPTIAALFDDFQDARDAYYGLLNRGFVPDEASLVTVAIQAEAAEEDLKGGGAAGISTAPAMFPLGGTGTAFAKGPITRLLAGAASGSLLRALMDMDLHEQEANIHAEGVRRGGNLILVQTADEKVEAARNVMREHNPVNIDERVRLWRETGWERFDEQAPPYTPAQIAQERQGARQRLPHTPGPTYPKRGTGGGAWSGEAPHTQDEKQIEEHARAEWLEAAHPTVVGPEAGPPEPGMQSPFDEDFRAHYAALYSNQGPYEEFEPGYRFGAMLGESEDYMGRDWDDVKDEARGRWEQTHPDTWNKYRDAIRYGWGRARGHRYLGPERRQQARNIYQYFW